MGDRGEYSKSKGDSEAVLEGNRQVSKGEKESKIEEGMRSKFNFLFGESIVGLFLSNGREMGNPLGFQFFVLFEWSRDVAEVCQFFDQGGLFLGEVS